MHLSTREQYWLVSGHKNLLNSKRSSLTLPKLAGEWQNFVYLINIDGRGSEGEQLMPLSLRIS